MSSCTRRLGGILAVALALVAVGTATAHAKPPKANHGKAQAVKGARSIGAPNGGHLAGAARLKGTKHLRQRSGAHSWGTSQLIHVISRAATDVARKHKGAQMLVGDLSARAGGHLDGHKSHQSGRDADIAFYVMNRAGKPVAVKHFVAFNGEGQGRELSWAYFDEARNWAMVESMLKNDKAQVRYLFVTNALRGKLLAYAAKKHVSKDLITRAASVMMSPADADVHDNHFHLRIACPESMRDVCTEESARGVARSAQPDANEKPAVTDVPASPSEAARAEKAAVIVAEKAETATN